MLTHAQVHNFDDPRDAYDQTNVLPDNGVLLDGPFKHLHQDEGIGRDWNIVGEWIKRFLMLCIFLRLLWHLECEALQGLHGGDNNICLGTTSIQNDGIPATCINNVIMVPSSSAGHVQKCEKIHINFYSSLC
jgi:hypothetical protein